MSESHTKEPWRLGAGTSGARYGAIVADEPVPEISGADAVEFYGGHLIAESIAPRNARRIIAAVNACAGLSDAELSQGVVALHRHSALAQERDELLEALHELKAAVEFTPLGVRGIKAVERARDAIARHAPAIDHAKEPSA